MAGAHDSHQLTRRPIPRRVILTRDEIGEAALRLTRRDGLTALTMRRLADELGVAASALYRHISGRDDLIEMLNDAVLNTIELTTPEQGDWASRLRQFTANIHKVLILYPGLVPELFENPSPAALRLIDHAVSILREGGLSGEDAYRTFMIMSIQCAARISGPKATTASTQRSILPNKASREAYPSLSDIGNPTINLDSIHALSLELLIAGLSTLTDRHPPASPQPETTSGPTS